MEREGFEAEVDLLTRLLMKDPSQRMNWVEYFMHPAVGRPDLVARLFESRDKKVDELSNMNYLLVKKLTDQESKLKKLEMTLAAMRLESQLLSHGDSTPLMTSNSDAIQTSNTVSHKKQVLFTPKKITFFKYEPSEGKK